MIFAGIGLIASLVGFGVTLYIQKKKQTNKPLACPRKMDCTHIVTGKYSTFFGFSNEKIGGLYYKSFTLIFFIVLLGTSVPLLPFVLVAALGLLFSLYLLFVQAFIIRAWCAWCLISAAMSLIIFAMTLVVQL